MGERTPGPWVALPLHLRQHGGHKPIFENGIWWIFPEANQERCPIAVVDTGDDHHEQTRLNSEADARLIAAAPDFAEVAPDALEMLERYAGYIREVRADELERHPYLPELERITDDLRAAIAKARGQ